jgi:hypothetical protein
MRNVAFQLWDCKSPAGDFRNIIMGDAATVARGNTIIRANASCWFVRVQTCCLSNRLYLIYQTLKKIIAATEILFLHNVYKTLFL